MTSIELDHVESHKLLMRVHLQGNDKVRRIRIDPSRTLAVFPGFIDRASSDAVAWYAEATSHLRPADRLRAPWHVDHITCTKAGPFDLATFALEDRVGKRRQARIFARRVGAGWQVTPRWPFYPQSGQLVIVIPPEAPFIILDIEARCCIPKFKNVRST